MDHGMPGLQSPPHLRAARGEGAAVMSACRSYQGDLGRLNRRQWRRRQRRKWRQWSQMLRAEMPRLDLWGLG
jgi:hypothetical protein